MPMWSNLSFQDSNSPSMEYIMYFHDHSMIIIIMITLMTLYIIMSLMLSKSFNKFMMEGNEIETIWTILPAFLLIFIALPSMKTLYLMEDIKMPTMTIKVNGHQWYWSYEYTSLNNKETENFMENSDTLRLMKTSELLNLPLMTSIRTMITSEDVIHSWAIPSLGVKVDAMPGRLNQTFLQSKRLGLFTGQCSEICGMNHSFMPILVKFSTIKPFIKMMKEN